MNPHKWGLLLPVCCRQSGGGSECFGRIQEFVESLQNTLPFDDRQNICVFIGIDQYDIFFDTEEVKQGLEVLFAKALIPNVKFVVLRSHFRGKLCRIWDFLAGKAVQANCDFFVLVGDDVRFLSNDWKQQIENQFNEISTTLSLPFGVGCVAFRDRAFKVFPTFPVIHRIHFEIFESLLPMEFVNQHGDPFLFEIYRRLGASEFASCATLVNTIGGAGKARYDKHCIEWHGMVLTTAISRLFAYLGVNDCEPCKCLDVVVPTFRCEVEVITAITSLKTSRFAASVNFLIVVDNPRSNNIKKLELLEDWTPNHLVRIHQNNQNMGASLSRNTGLASSHGDWVVFLDDDVVPNPNILDAYLGATIRHPQAEILVGSTSLPFPILMMEHAIVASQMTYFFDVANKMKHPPWGVTANICVRGRSDNRIWFDKGYRKSGGGEDVDFCFRVKDLKPPGLRTASIVAVPEANVQHPFWNRITRQVVGWALGDVRCLDKLPSRTFHTLPDWIEILFIAFVLTALLSHDPELSSFRLKLPEMSAAVVASEIAFLAIAAYPHTPATMSLTQRLGISIIAAHLPMAQDATRLGSKLLRLRMSHICVRFDWMDGQAGHVAACQMVSVLKNLVYAALLRLAHVGSSDIFEIAMWSAFILIMYLIFWSMRRCSEERSMSNLALGIQPLPFQFNPEAPAPFVVLSFQRSGSNFLCGKMHNHPEIVMHNEVFNMAKIYSYVEDELLADPSWNWDILKRDLAPFDFLRDLFSRKSINKARAKVTGIKLFPEHWTHATEETLQMLLVDQRVKKIVLRRENYLAVYVSKLRADKTGMYLTHSLNGVKVNIDPAAFDSFVEYYDSCYTYMDSFLQGQVVHRVTYEQLTGPDGDEVLLDIFQFLQIENSVPTAALDATVKQSTSPLSEGIENYDEICAAFGLHPKIAQWLC